MPIVQQPGAVGSARKPSNAPKPIRKPFVPPKAKATTAITVGDIMIQQGAKLASAPGGSSHTFTLPDRSTIMEPSDNEIAASKPRDVPGDEIDTSYHRASSISTNPGPATSRWTPGHDLRAMYASARAPPRRAPAFYDDAIANATSQAALGIAGASTDHPFVDPVDPDISVNF
jgi:hypothetical protein